VPPPLDEATDAWRSLPAARRDEVAAQLEPGEVVLAWFEPDLDTRLDYAEGLVVLTDRRLRDDGRASDEGPAGGNGKPGGHWRSWPLEEVAELRAREHAGLGTIELLGPSGRLAHWRYTNARASAVHRLALRFEAFRRGDRAEVAAEAEATCPTCGAVVPADQAACPACAPPVAPSTASALVRLVRFARPRAGMVALGFVLTVASTGAGMIPPYLTEPLFDRVLIPKNKGQDVSVWLLYWYLGLMAGTAVLAWILGWARTWVIARVSERISGDLRDRTYAHLLRLSLEFFGGKRTGDLMTRIGSDTDRICNFLSVNLLDFATDVLMIAFTAAIMVSKDPLLAAVTLLPIPLGGWLVHVVRQKLRRGFEQGNRAWAAMTSVLADTIPGIRVVKAFAQEQREIERFAQRNQHVIRVNDRVNDTWSYFGPLITFLTQVGLLLVWAVGAWLVFQRGFKVGILMMFLTLIYRFYTRLESMSRMVQATQRAAASAQRIFEILDRVPSVAEPARPVSPGRLQGSIELRDVGFRYGNRAVLQGVNLSIRPGEMIGLVGPSGSGKSTLVNLVCRFYDVTEGSIRVDGVDIRQYPIEPYRKFIGIVLQEPFLFFGTIAENIAYGRPDASRAEIIAAARAARAHEFILRLPDGYDSMVGERGQSLSGGERQRISIARALLIDPKILILDEATSAVDTETEREIQEALDNLTRGRTTIAIAHRLSTLRKADRLVVMERGRIAEVGHHRELLKSPGAYARLHHAQAQLAGLEPLREAAGHP
jgi:ATP-binding cassette, subfamily B, bacterial